MLHIIKYKYIYLRRNYTRHVFYFASSSCVYSQGFSSVISKHLLVVGVCAKQRKLPIINCHLEVMTIHLLHPSDMRKLRFNMGKCFTISYSPHDIPASLRRKEETLTVIFILISFTILLRRKVGYRKSIMLGFVK
jgi:hypothetical protein